MTYKEAAERLGLSTYMVHQYAGRLKLPKSGRDAKNRPCYDLTEEHLEAIRHLREERRQKATAIRAAQCRGRPCGGHEHIERLARKSRLRAIQRQDTDYFGCVTAFSYEPSVVEELSSTIPGGPVMATMQWRPFYPRLNGDLNAWSKGDTWNPLSLDSDEWMFDRLALQVWYEHNRRTA
jgi:DNA-binding transcriptional MerR regulator